MAYLEEVLSEFRKGNKIRRKCWDSAYYVYQYGDFIYSARNCLHCLNAYELNASDWELYQEPDIDWEYIIKNECLCWFWDDVEFNKVIGCLSSMSKNKSSFWNYEDKYYKNCRPIYKNEIVFYEDRES